MFKKVLIALMMTPALAASLPTASAEAVSARVTVRIAAPRLVIRPNVVVGTRIAVAPRGHRVVTYRQTNYVVHGGIYYRPVGGRYQVVAAPAGLRVTTLPVGHQTFRVNGRTYYFHGGNYYRATKRGFAVIKRPNRGPRFIVAVS